jgi:hypothetical protein
VRILLLGDSNDTGSWVEERARKRVLVQERLAADLGEPVEWVVKGIWPNPDLPALVERWVSESQPDLVYVNTGSYWFLYRSVPLRVKRVLRRFGGESVGEAGAKVARSRKWAHNAVFRGIRKVLTNTIGGDTNFTTQEVIDRMSDCIRIAARVEGTVVVVKGPKGKARYSRTERGFRRDEAERMKLHNALDKLCKQLHITYDGVGEGGVRDTAAYRRGTTIGDGLHADAELHVHEAGELYRGIHQGLVEAGRL